VNCVGIMSIAAIAAQDNNDVSMFAASRPEQQAMPCFIRIAGFLQLDIPAFVIYQAIRTAVNQLASAGINRIAFIGGKLSDEWELVGVVEHAHQIVGGGSIARRQPGGIREMCLAHAQLSGFLIHPFDKKSPPAGVGTAQCRSRAVFRRHQGDMQHIAARQHGTYQQSGVGSLQDIPVFRSDLYSLLELRFVFHHDDGGHQFA